MGVILTWLARSTGRFVLAFAALFALWVIGSAAVGSLARVAAELERWDDANAELNAADQAVAELEAELARIAAERDAAATIATELEAAREDAEAAIRQLEQDAAAAEAIATSTAGELRERGQRELQQWDRRVREACDTRWYQIVRRQICEEAIAQRDQAMDNLHAWEADRAAEVREAEARLRAFTSERESELAAAAEAARGLASAEALQSDLAEREAAHAEDLEAVRDRLRAAADDVAHLTELRESTEAWVLAELRRVGARLALFLLLAFATPYIYRTVVYYVFMHGIEKVRPLRLSEPGGRSSVRYERADRTMVVDMHAGQILWARSRDLRPVTPGAAETQVLFDWRSPLVSLVARLYLLTRVVPREDGVPEVRATLAPSGEDGADSYIMRIDLDDHPGLVIHPRHIVAILGDVRIRRRWALTNLHAWATGQLRFILLEGTGSVFLEGVGDLVGERLEGGVKQESHASIVAFDSRLAWTTRRTETALPYILGLKPLVEVGLEGDGVFFWQKSDRASDRNVVQRTFDTFLGALGKVLGF